MDRDTSVVWLERGESAVRSDGSLFTAHAAAYWQVEQDEAGVFIAPQARFPATLTTVDDVRQVCEAAGLERATRTDTPEWADRYIAVVFGGIPGESYPIVATYLRGGRGYVDLWEGAPAPALWHAIQVARGVS